MQRLEKDETYPDVGISGMNGINLTIVGLKAVTAALKLLDSRQVGLTSEQGS
jgi:hypothetical protein